MRAQLARLHKGSRLIATVLFGLSLGCLPLRAQQAVNAVLYGSVSDVSGAPIPGAKLIARNVETGITTERSSDSTGEYLFPSLAPGHYAVQVAKSGFSTKDVSGLTLLVNQQARVDVELNVGAVTTVVEVRGTPPLVDTSTASVGTVVGEREVEDFPLNLRYVEALATLVPGRPQTVLQAMRRDQARSRLGDRLSAPSTTQREATATPATPC
ncbi:MAG TPA: carboxypeptidase-like regulatory domain-containing protein [Terriglobia bacterium]|nr:carboxypeptidase-like regulatory domain-containing protein [Terriglobia bacterium]